ncbi:MAG: PQQ-dependent dehydrogenase, methanol/ethanol family [Bryobacteraceae bacterium]|nr:PQQ-dependent dehydrogenase, methanol/ethanol family [Bryobacteraceae bacterium]
MMMVRRIALLVFPALAAAQHAQDVDNGRQIFERMCSACHGDTAKGGRGSDLTTGEWKHGGSDADLVRNITKGIPGTQMPAIAMPESDARAVIAFLRSLSGGADEKVDGDPEAGRRLFFGSAGCAKCHMFGGQGGRLGPDLTMARARRKVGELRKSIAEPNAALTRGFETVEVTTKGGQAIRGVKRNDDTFSVQLMDTGERLHMLLKKDLASFETPYRSLMPAYAQDSAGLNHMLAFLTRFEPAALPQGQWKPAADLNVTYARLRNAAAEPQNWLTYWGDYAGRHYSALTQITPRNAGQLRSAWAYQFGGPTNETTPIVVDGIMYVTGPLNDAAALDARTGRVIWRYTRRLPKVASHCTVMTNRGFAMLGDRLYLATLDMRLVALDAKTGNVIWEKEVDDYTKGFSITHAPLAIDGKIIVGVTSGECALYGFIDAFDAATGKKLWRVHAIAQPGDPNRATWAGDSANYGGSPTWTTGTYDPDTNTLFWATGNPGPDYDGTPRAGDNLYSCSVLAIDAATGKMKWWFQFTPHDVHDWDGNQTPMLIDGVVRGQKRKLLVSAQRNAFYYVLDRTTGEFLSGKAFARQTWAKGLDDKGRPIVLPNTTPTPEGNYVCPDAAGAANWGSPSYDASLGLFFVSVREACATYTSAFKKPVPGEGYTGGGQEIDPRIGTPGAVRALEATSGDVKWNFPLHTGSSATGVLATGGGVVVAASADGNLIVLDSKTGRDVWHYQTGAAIKSGPISYSVDGRQYIAIAAESALFTFTLP